MKDFAPDTIIELESNTEQTVYHITIGSLEAMEEMDVIEILKKLIADVEDGSREIETHDSLIDEN